MNSRVLNFTAAENSLKRLKKRKLPTLETIDLTEVSPSPSSLWDYSPQVTKRPRVLDSRVGATVEANSTKPSKQATDADVANPQLPFRTLVVVPRSHIDGTFETICGSEDRHGQVRVSASNIASRAVQLDLRPFGERRHQSVFVAWDSRLVHQGHTHIGRRKSRCFWRPKNFGPPLLKPTLFQIDKDSTWRGSLKEEGYVAFTDILSAEDVDEALRLLLRDIQRFNPELKCLGDVREHHLPPTPAANDLRTGRGLCHGEFAWFLRCHKAVARLFEMLFNLPFGAPLTGSVDVVALAPPGSSATHGAGKRWLHVDYTPPQGRIWQASIQLFPRTVAQGARWERIALMVCKAPVAWSTPRALHALLACCVSGAASRATAGVTVGKLHPARSSQQSGRRLLAAVAGAPIVVVDLQASVAGVDKRGDSIAADAGDGGCSGAAGVDKRCARTASCYITVINAGRANEVVVADRVPYIDLRLSSPVQVMRRHSARALLSLVAPKVRHYIAPAWVNAIWNGKDLGAPLALCSGRRGSVSGCRQDSDMLKSKRLRSDEADVGARDSDTRVSDLRSVLRASGADDGALSSIGNGNNACSANDRSASSTPFVPIVSSAKHMLCSRRPRPAVDSDLANRRPITMAAATAAAAAAAAASLPSSAPSTAEELLALLEARQAQRRSASYGFAPRPTIPESGSKAPLSPRAAERKLEGMAVGVALAFPKTAMIVHP
eukprot:TRINITY_DN56656_c0_g1_i1.p1 TRINITY_DN56656_c0_g1~~TRINITY_DN56656_c0_g1_i1.p1  ORF type:complete len:721 (+),score=113.83 TRINITY_DN56656_c0_g1_i1:97-2259(+)